jgi:hypothetical protein
MIFGKAHALLRSYGHGLKPYAIAGGDVFSTLSGRFLPFQIGQNVDEVLEWSVLYCNGCTGATSHMHAL